MNQKITISLLYTLDTYVHVALYTNTLCTQYSIALCDETAGMPTLSIQRAERGQSMFVYSFVCSLIIF